METPVAGRYDRQLRLWGSWGQTELEHSYILFLGCHPLWVEALESLAASGLSEYAIVDDQLLSKCDVASYFCLARHQSDIGQKSRAELIVRYMSEINPQCKGHPITKSPEVFAREVCEAGASANNPLEHKEPGQLVIVSVNQPLMSVNNLRLAFAAKVVTTSCYILSVGPFASLYNKSDFHLTWSTRDKRFEYDLCLEPPHVLLDDLELSIWQIMLDEKSKEDYLERPRSVPYAVLLSRVRRLFQEKYHRMPHAGDRKSIEALLDTFEFSAGIALDPECVEEARKNVFQLCRQYEVPAEIATAFTRVKSLQRTDKTEKIVMLIEALEKFWNTYGRLPLNGVCPDMISESQFFLAMRRRYQAVAKQDLSALIEFMASGGWDISTLGSIKEFLAGKDLKRLSMTCEAAGAMVGPEEISAALNEVAMTESVLESEPVAAKESLAWQLSYRNEPLPSVASLYLCLMAFSSLLEYHSQGKVPINADTYLTLAYSRLKKAIPDAPEVLEDTRHIKHLM
eukprot:Blabericola_migrator_1__3086@NODE_18_length_22925_cov_118_464826_g15_i0_p4_GENE_NODE_18_length_22925_cov_118_464826_g15_i0NODE_18_length_22925_cov_118_464826_g15_i0_p4_ORF_typecomplete_len512_score49_29ThiF/PF00899_21/1_1e14_NODE_18_length_22925_cov_118_464826_g15_i0865610191